eukprot:8713393-Karenia_brevis.AAC.1
MSDPPGWMRIPLRGTHRLDAAQAEGWPAMWHGTPSIQNFLGMLQMDGRLRPLAEGEPGSHGQAGRPGRENVPAVWMSI